MNKEEAIDILENCIADYIISEYCEKCGDNKICNERNEDCYYQQAIDIVLNLIQKQEKIIDYSIDRILPSPEEYLEIKNIMKQNKWGYDRSKKEYFKKVVTDTNDGDIPEDNLVEKGEQS